MAGQLADLLTTHAFVRRDGIHAEANPLIRKLFHVGGMPAVYALKLGVVGYTVSRALADPDPFERERTLVLYAWFGLAPVLNNLDILVRG